MALLIFSNMFSNSETREFNQMRGDMSTIVNRNSQQAWEGREVVMTKKAL